MKKKSEVFSHFQKLDMFGTFDRMEDSTSLTNLPYISKMREYEEYFDAATYPSKME